MRIAFVIAIVLWSTTAWAELPQPQAVCDQAISHAELEGALDNWSGRANARHLLPEIEAEVAVTDTRGVTDNFRETLTPSDSGFIPKSLQTTTDNDNTERFALKFRATFDFKGLIFDPQEIRAEVVSRDRAAERDLRCMQVIDLYFDWWALRFRQESKPTDAVDQARLQAKLDVLTGGWFTKQLREKQ